MLPLKGKPSLPKQSKRTSGCISQQQSKLQHIKPNCSYKEHNLHIAATAPTRGFKVIQHHLQTIRLRLARFQYPRHVGREPHPYCWDPRDASRIRPWIESSKSPIAYAIKENIRRHEAITIKPQNINLHKATTNPTRGIKVMSSRTSTRPNNSISRT
jgi:hypothetical protein